MFIVRDLTPLSHNCLILESKEMQGYIVSALWGNAVCQQCEQTHEMNVEWVQRKWGVSFKEKYSCSGREGKDRRKLDTSEAENKWTSWNKHIKLNRNGEVKLWLKEMWVCKEEQQKSFSYTGNSFSWTVSSPSVWSGLYRVWRFWCLLDGHRKWSTPPSPVPWVIRRKHDPLNMVWCRPPLSAGPEHYMGAQQGSWSQHWKQR